MPIAEIIKVAAACLKGTIDFCYLPRVVWNETMPGMERLRSRAA